MVTLTHKQRRTITILISIGLLFIHWSRSCDFKVNVLERLHNYSTHMLRWYEVIHWGTRS